MQEGSPPTGRVPAPRPTRDERASVDAAAAAPAGGGLRGLRRLGGTSGGAPRRRRGLDLDGELVLDVRLLVVLVVLLDLLDGCAARRADRDAAAQRGHLGGERLDG